MSDADFWLLLQSSVMQLLGLFTPMLPVYRRPSKYAWVWTWVLVAAGSCCAIIVVPLYVIAPTIWSALLSFFGSAGQAFMLLQLALFVDGPRITSKKDR